MESNMTTLKRRLNQAIGECRSHASVTARRLVRSTILTTGGSGGSSGEGPPGCADLSHEETLWRMSTQSNHSSKTSARQVRHSTISGRPFARHNRPTFSYSFEPLGPTQDDSGGNYSEQHLAGADDAQAKWSRLTASEEHPKYTVTSTARQSHLLTKSEFSPQQQQLETCHHHYHQNDHLQDHTNRVQHDDQENANVLSSNCEQHQQQQTITTRHISPTTSGCLPQVHLIPPLDLQPASHHLHMVSGHEATSSQVTNTSGNTMQGQYFMRSSLNESIKARRSHRRSHRRSSGAGRRLGPQLSGHHHHHPRRQVRFQPIPQAINISAYSSGGSDVIEDENEEPDTPGGVGSNSSQLSTSSISGLETSIGHSDIAGEQPRPPVQAHTSTTGTNSAFSRSPHHRINIKRMQQQLTRLGRKSRLKVSSGVRPAVRFSSKPFTQQFVGNIKPSFVSFGGKIKSFASHIQQSLASSTSHTMTPSQIPVPPPTPRLPLQKTFHLRNSAATAKHQIHLSGSNSQTLVHQHERVIAPLLCQTHVHSLQQQQQQLQPPAADLDDGWGSDFDDTPSNVATADQSAASELQTSTGNNDTTTCSTASGCYLLEIGKSSCDTRAVGDVIQDQGICGQFKRLHDVSLLDIPYRPPVKSDDKHQLEQVRLELERVDLQANAPEVTSSSSSAGEGEVARPRGGGEFQSTGTEAEDEDDEAELRSLEARQGFRQVRDKLKLILDQRLACYERDLTSGGATPKTQQQSKLLKSEPLEQVGGQAGDKSVRSNIGVVVEVQVDHGFDCRSNCSEASSLSSGGLDSNHSGSQDSGHSTQHSGYSSSAALHRHHARPTGSSVAVTDTPQVSGTSTETSPTNQLDSGASTCGDPEPSPPLPASQVAARQQMQANRQQPLSSTPKPQPVPNSPRHLAPCTEQQVAGASSPECDQERRQRFIQNRLVINKKLESMFRSRSGGLNASPAAASRQSINGTPDHANNFSSPSKSIQSCPTPSAIDSAAQIRLTSCQSEPSMMRAAATGLDPTTRLKLLEQQRQMSLKLKQKPRRRSAKRALNLDCGASLASCSGSSTGGGCNASLDSQSITTITNEDGTIETPHHTTTHQSSHHYQRNNNNSQAQKSSRFSRNGSTRRWNQENLTKQLSMVCLRQLERNDEQQVHDETTRHNARNHQSKQQQQQATLTPLPQVPRPAMSLRQLVKEEIDDCARPGRLSTLTRNILNRSDSLSSGDGGSGEQLC